MNSGPKQAAGNVHEGFGIEHGRHHQPQHEEDERDDRRAHVFPPCCSLRVLRRLFLNQSSDGSYRAGKPVRIPGACHGCGTSTATAGCVGRWSMCARTRSTRAFRRRVLSRADTFSAIVRAAVSAGASRSHQRRRLRLYGQRPGTRLVRDRALHRAWRRGNPDPELEAERPADQIISAARPRCTCSELSRPPIRVARGGRCGAA
jgi:hypothetical protein